MIYVPLVLQLLQALPSLIKGVEALWAHKPKSGPEKWLAVEQAASGTIESIADAIVKANPNAKVDAVTTAVAQFTKAANDALVKLYNDVGWPTS